MPIAEERAQQRLPNHAAAQAVMQRIFASTTPGIRYRLWDGSEADIGKPDGSFTIIIRSPGAFRAAFGAADTKALAEAYADNRVDVDGDLLACLRIANQLEEREFSLAEKLRLFFDLRRV
ncbi:MAG: hypothetical protein VCC00_12735 [Deltaproteobacteria bacterium]